VSDLFWISIESISLSNGEKVLFDPPLAFESCSNPPYNIKHGTKHESVEVRRPGDPDFRLVLPGSNWWEVHSQIVAYLRQSWEDNVWLPEGGPKGSYGARFKSRLWLNKAGKEEVAPFEDLILNAKTNPIVVPILVQEVHPNDFNLKLDTSKVSGLEDAKFSLWLGNRSSEARRIAVESLRKALEERLEHLWEKNRVSEKSALPMLGLGVLGVFLLSTLASLSQKKTLKVSSSPATVEALEEEESDMSDMTTGVTGGRK
jgi:hypothetical protein